MLRVLRKMDRYREICVSISHYHQSRVLFANFDLSWGSSGTRHGHEGKSAQLRRNCRQSSTLLSGTRWAEDA